MQKAFLVLRNSCLWGVLKKTWFVSLILGISLVQPAFPQAQAKPEINPKLLAALATQDWSQVVRETDGQKNLSPVLRLLRAHASLATNRNNESICLFLATSSETDLKAWDDWTRKYVQENPNHVEAHFLRADSLARLGQWDQALTTLSQALAINPRHALSLNMRGTIQAARGKWDEALVDFDSAAQVDPKLADAFASLGATYVNMHTGADGALQAFDQAIKLSPKFALAYNGRGCAKVAKGRLQEALNDLKKAAELNQCFNIQLANLASLGRLIEEITAEREAKIGKLKPGMTSEARAVILQNMTPTEKLKEIKNINNHRAWCNFAAWMGDSISGVDAKIQTSVGLKAEVPVKGLTVGGEVGKSQNLAVNLKNGFSNLATTSRRDGIYWGATISQAITSDPSVAKNIKNIMPGGITAEDLEHAYVDKGKWLETGFGLAYNIGPK